MLVVVPLKTDTEKALENLQMELINLQHTCTKSPLIQHCKIFILTCQKKNVFIQVFWVKNDCNVYV
jgi:hypothetical protein